MRTIYAACLASYNAGVLHGAFIDMVGADIDDVQDQIATMLRASPCPNVQVECPECEGTGNAPDDRPAGVPPLCETCKGDGEVPSAEEYAVHDYDGIPSSFGEYPNLDDILTYVELVEEHGSAFKVWFSYAGDGVELDGDAFLEAYRGTSTSWVEMAEELLDETGGLDGIPDHLLPYFDYHAYARDLQMGGDMWADAATETGDLHFFWSH